MSSAPNNDYLERVRAEIRAEAAIARERIPLPRVDPPAAAVGKQSADGIEHDRLDYAIEELTGTHYIAFIHHAFRALLKRAPDDAGCTTQIRLLASGSSQAEVLGNLRWSAEGRRVGAHVRGLLPRYALAKLVRVPVLGYCIEWSIALVGLPVLLHHQRATDTSVAARFAVTADTQREHAARLLELDKTIGELPANLDQRVADVSTELRRVLQRLAGLEMRAIEMEARSTAPSLDHAERAREMTDLLHSVHTTNHWVASLQSSLVLIEDAAQARHARADRLVAAANESAPTYGSRQERNAIWARAMATQLPSTSIVLDLGSGDGAWVETMSTCGIAVRGVEANAVWVANAQARGIQIELGNPHDALERCPDASLGGLVIAAGAFSASDVVIAELLAHAQRVLRADGCLLLRLESDAMCSTAVSAASIDALEWVRILRAAGFALVRDLSSAGATALLVRRA